MPDHLGSILPGETIDFTFPTVSLAGVPTTLAGTPAVSVYKANNTTESAAGVTLTVDYDGRTGLNHVRVVTSDSFYSAAGYYQVIITAGTVDGESVVGAVLATFRVQPEPAIYQPTGRLFRVVASGGNASGNMTWSDPGTLAAALAAASHGDTISLAAGTYTFGIDEQADLSALSHVTLMGDSADTTSLVGTDAGSAASLGDYCRLLHLTIDNTASGEDFAAVLGNGATGCEVGYCVLRGTGDALFGNGMTNAWIHHTTASGTWDAVVGLADRCLIEFCDFSTDGTNIGAGNSVALSLGDGCTVRNCKLTATQASSTSSKVRGLMVSGDCLVESCEIIATQSNAGSTGDAIGIEALAGATVTVLGGRQVVTNAGAGAATKIDATATGADKIDFGTVPEEVLATFNADSDYIALKSNVAGIGPSLVTIDSKTSDAKAASESADTKLSTARLAKVDNLLASGTYATDADVAAAAGTVTAEDISRKRTWRFPESGSSIVSSNTVPVAASQSGTVTVCFDLDGVLEENVVVASTSTPTITGSAATIGTQVVHTSKRKINIPLTGITASVGDYVVEQTFVATDTEQYVVRGVLRVE